MCRGRRARILLHLTVRRDSLAREPSWSAFWLQKPSTLRACVKEEDAGGREAGAHSTTPTYRVRRDGPAREPSWSAFRERSLLRFERSKRYIAYGVPFVTNSLPPHPAYSERRRKKGRDVTAFSQSQVPSVT